MVNVEDEDQTQEARVICRSLACIRMELCKFRLATTHKLRQEWDKRLQNNSTVVGRLQENGELWLRAGVSDLELLVTPTKMYLERGRKDRAYFPSDAREAWAKRRS